MTGRLLGRTKDDKGVYEYLRDSILIPNFVVIGNDVISRTDVKKEVVWYSSFACINVMEDEFHGN
jgi:hypothetical protein